MTHEKIITELDDIHKLENIRKDLSYISRKIDKDYDFTDCFLEPMGFLMCLIGSIAVFDSIIEINIFIPTGGLFVLSAFFYTKLFFAYKKIKKTQENLFQQSQKQHFIEAKTPDEYLHKIINDIPLKLEEIKEDKSFLQMAQKYLNNKTNEISKHHSSILQKIYGEKLDVKKVKQDFKISY